LKILIVNADDFGFTRDVNAGIVEAHERGILTSTTLMANGAAFDDAVRLAREHPTLDVGCHLVLAGGESVLAPGRALPRTVPELIRAICLRKISVYDELAAQVRKILDAGIRPTHLDTHKHTHLFPPVLDAVARIGDEFDIRWIRRPMDFPMESSAAPLGKRVLSRSLHGLRNGFHRKIERRGCRTTDHFAGFEITGIISSRNILELLRALPEGTTEFMCHPGCCGEELMAARTRLKQSRRAELEALIDPEVRRGLAATNVRLASFRELNVESTEAVEF
jgi:predicted glycoside hydrolase/deacetylase ChbG (UPF0249 family)